MKEKALAVCETAIECIHFTIIAFVLSAMAFIFRHDALFILFFASEIALLPDFWNKLSVRTHRKWLNVLLIAVCFAAELLLAYFAGLPSIPFTVTAH